MPQNKLTVAQKKVIALMRKGGVLLRSSPAGKWILDNGHTTDQTAKALLRHDLIEPYNWLLKTSTAGIMEYTLT